ncbi:PREDICTED: alpha-crystallin A chain-like [Eufriesea mexicana]|uniref:alpha-crystallin A chain-like n=1 Tax=Eufriesea mexicana TaxID=516756 RepID=UPI00083BC51E|nr:PREDICTED: alpha-crystallin A chain-like [Eufriesea mexicana]
MSLKPSTFWTDLETVCHILNQTLGRLTYPEILNPRIMGMQKCDLPLRKRKLFSPVEYHRPSCDLLFKGDRGASTVMADKNNFRVDLDVQHFAPEEINVKIVDSYVIVEAKHEEKEDEYGWISREFTRKYIIPKQCDIEQVSSKLSSDGVLSIIVPQIEKIDSGLLEYLLAVPPPLPTTQRIV